MGIFASTSSRGVPSPPPIWGAYRRPRCFGGRTFASATPRRGAYDRLRHFEGGVYSLPSLGGHVSSLPPSRKGAYFRLHRLEGRIFTSTDLGKRIFASADLGGRTLTATASRGCGDSRAPRRGADIPLHLVESVYSLPPHRGVRERASLREAYHRLHLFERAYLRRRLFGGYPRLRRGVYSPPPRRGEGVSSPPPRRRAYPRPCGFEGGVSPPPSLRADVLSPPPLRGARIPLPLFEGRTFTCAPAASRGVRSPSPLRAGGPSPPLRGAHPHRPHFEEYLDFHRFGGRPFTSADLRGLSSPPPLREARSVRLVEGCIHRHLVPRAYIHLHRCFRGHIFADTSLRCVKRAPLRAGVLNRPRRFVGRTLRLHRFGGRISAHTSSSGRIFACASSRGVNSPPPLLEAHTLASTVLGGRGVSEG